MHLLRQDVKTKYSAFLLQDGVFNTFGDDMTVYLRSRNTAGELTGLLIHDARDKEKPPVTVTAKRGRILTDGDVPRIIVYDGMRQQPDLKTGAISKLFFSQYAIEINTTDSAAPARWREASERTLYELLNPDMSIKRDRMFQGYFFAEANHRLMAPFNALGFTMVALGCILLGPFNRRGQTRKVILAATLIVLLQSLHLTLASFDKKYLGALPLLYLLTFAPIGFGFYALRLKGEQQIMAILRKWNARQLPAEGASA
jgi:lipopolysaccharide export system permease protein